MGYYAVGSALTDSFPTGAEFQAALLKAGTSVAPSTGLISSLVGPVLNGAGALFNQSKAPAAAPRAAPMGYQRLAPAAQAIAQSKIDFNAPPGGGGGTVFGVPTMYLVIGGVGLGALLLLKKKH
jgi:hypothetical protein